jgi:PKD repeat protein
MAVVEHSSANTNLFYAARSDNKLFRSDNCLATNPAWYDLSGLLPASGTPSDIESHPADENIVYITLGNKVYKSEDKGASWTNITGNLPTITKNTIAFYRNAPEGLYVGTDAGVYYKDETTSEWIQFNSGMPANARVTELEIYYDNDSVSEDVIRASTYGRGLWSSDLYQTSPVADFTTADTLVPVGCAVNFSDVSTGVPTWFQWTFPGGNPSTSTLKHPRDITYSAPGTYEVKLKVWNQFGSDSITKSGYITVSSTLLPAVDFTADQNMLCNTNIVRFTDKSSNCPDEWNWSIYPNTVTFVEGTSANSQNPVVWFTEAGAYDVQLVSSNATGSETLFRPDFIIKDGYALPFVETFETGMDTRHWQVINPDMQITWDTITVGGIAPGSKAVYMDFFNYAVVNRRDQLISPAVNLTGYSIVNLSFKHAYEQRVRKDSLIIRISDDCGATWERVWGMGPNGTPEVFVTHPSTDSAFYPQTSNDWCGGSYGTSCYSIDLSPWAGKSNIMLMFEAYNRYGNNLFLNDIQISGPVGANEITKNPVSVNLYPNPSDGRFNLLVSNWKGTMSLTVTNLHGQALFSGTLTGDSGRIQSMLDLSAFGKGVYFIRLTGERDTWVEKVVVE